MCTCCMFSTLTLLTLLYWFVVFHPFCFHVIHHGHLVDTQVWLLVVVYWKVACWSYPLLLFIYLFVLRYISGSLVWSCNPRDMIYYVFEVVVAFCYFEVITYLWSCVEHAFFLLRSSNDFDEFLKDCRADTLNCRLMLYL